MEIIDIILLAKFVGITIRPTYKESSKGKIRGIMRLVIMVIMVIMVITLITLIVVFMVIPSLASRIKMTLVQSGLSESEPVKVGEGLA